MTVWISFDRCVSLSTELSPVLNETFSRSNSQLSFQGIWLNFGPRRECTVPGYHNIGQRICSSPVLRAYSNISTLPEVTISCMAANIPSPRTSVIVICRLDTHVNRLLSYILSFAWLHARSHVSKIVLFSVAGRRVSRLLYGPYVLSHSF